MVRTARLTTLFLITVLVVSSVSTLAEERPLPRYRLGPDGKNATPAPRPGQPLTPYSFTVPRPEAAPDTCLIQSPPEYSPIDGVLYQYLTGQWDDIVTDLVASLTGDPAYDEIAYVVVDNVSEQSSAESAFSAACTI